MARRSAPTLLGCHAARTQVRTQVRTIGCIRALGDEPKVCTRVVICGHLSVGIRKSLQVLRAAKSGRVGSDRSPGILRKPVESPRLPWNPISIARSAQLPFSATNARCQTASRRWVAFDKRYVQSDSCQHSVQLGCLWAVDGCGERCGGTRPMRAFSGAATSWPCQEADQLVSLQYMYIVRSMPGRVSISTRVVCSGE